MKITQRREEVVTILVLDGKLSIGDGDVKLRTEIDRVLKDGARKILVDLKHVRAMDSSGLGELVRTKGTAEAQDAEIKLVNVESKVREILTMTRLIGIFDTFEDEIDAVASFRA